MRGRPAWLVPAGVMPTGVGSARGQAAGGDYPLRGCKGQPRGQGCRLQGRPLLQGQRPRKATPPAREVPPEGSSALDSVQRRQRHSEGKGRGLGHPFEKRMIIPL
ncbi:hypothetical protein BHM03_00043752 [Ensete ventricosum]|nr:hypothetical protein BHM03_00043752 [Ensete ventricosum]